MGTAALVGLVGCASAKSAATATTAGSTAAQAASTSGICEVIPNETAGPYPGDGSNGANVLNVSGVVRSDIRSSFGTSTTTAKGVPLTIKLSIVELAKSCGPLVGAAVYLWHCNIDGQYSMYSNGVTNEKLSSWRAGDGCRRDGHVHIDLPRWIFGAVAAHPLWTSVTSWSSVSPILKATTSPFAFGPFGSKLRRRFGLPCRPQQRARPSSLSSVS